MDRMNATVSGPCPATATMDSDDTSGEPGPGYLDLDMGLLMNTLLIGVWTSYIAWSIPKLIAFKRSAVPFSPFTPKSPTIFKIQTRLTQFMIALTLLGSKLEPTALLPCIAWALSHFLAQFDATREFSSETKKFGHPKCLKAFWTFSFGLETYHAVIAILDEDFDVFSVHFGFLITRLIVSELVLLVGLYAPGLPALVKRDANGKEEEEQSNSSSDEDDSDLDENENCSEDRNKLKKFVSKLPLREKLKLLKPFLWPTNPNARFFVLISLTTLGIDRFLHFSDNIYKKMIVDSLNFHVGGGNDTDAAGETGDSLLHLEFRWDYVVYSALIHSTQQITNLIRETLQLKTQNLISSGMQVQLFEKLHNLSLRWHLERRTGSILRKLQSPFGYTSNILEYFITEICTGWSDLIISLVYISQAYNERVTALLVITVIASVGVSLAFHTWDRQYEAWLRQLEAAKLDKAVDSIINFETVKYFSNEAYETKRFLAACQAQQALSLKKHSTQQYSYALRKTVQNFVLLGVKLGCLWMVLKSQGVSAGDYVFLAAALYQFSNPLSGVLWTYKNMMVSLDELEELQEVLDLQPEIVNAPNAGELVVGSGDIEVRNVSFHYIPEKQILHNISFKVKGGETLAIVGESGSGKSTMIKLLFRFYDVVSGEILIDGQNVRKVTQHSLRKAIGVVPQDTVLFNDTIATNLKYGNLESTTEDVIKAAKHACIHNRIKTFKDGYQTQVAERGLKLSGGEKQRVAIARMLLKDPQIFLLDEATSALDTHTERDIRQSLTNACKNRTSIIIAHRLSTITHANNILVLQSGRIAESGTHDQLMNMNGIYAKMWKQQIHTESNNNSVEQ